MERLIELAREVSRLEAIVSIDGLRDTSRWSLEDRIAADARYRIMEDALSRARSVYAAELASTPTDTLNRIIASPTEKDDGHGRG